MALFLRAFSSSLHLRYVCSHHAQVFDGAFNQVSTLSTLLEGLQQCRNSPLVVQMWTCPAMT